MTTPSPDEPGAPDEPGLTGHELLLRLAGRIPDDELSDGRRLLAGGDVRGAMTGVARWLAGEPVPLLAAELAAIRALAGDPGALPGYQPDPVLPALPFAFSELDRRGEIGRDVMDDAVAAVAAEYGVAGLWRSWRYRLDDPAAAGGSPTVTVDPDDPGNPDQAYRVYIAQVEDASMIADLTRGLLRAVDDTGRAGTEVILLSAEPPPYQDLALAQSNLLWASQGEPEFELAAVFDFADPVSGPGFAPDHAVVDDPDERERILAYLRGGVPVLLTTAAMPDILDPAAGAVVPANFRTDGEWIWTDSVDYYLSRHGLAPDPRLTEHIGAALARGQAVPAVDEETAGRAADFLLDPLGADPARG
jgi:hypothetical protein